MDIVELNKNPPVYVIKSAFTEEERFKILNELLFLHDKLPDQSVTSAGIDNEGKYITSKKGRWLDDVYSIREMSDILNINRKVYEIMLKIDHWYFSYKGPYIDHTLVSYYEEADYYKAHTDESFVTGITWFYQKPKNFYGGNLEIPSLNLTIPCEDNVMVLFPGGLLRHNVTNISMLDKSREKSGRFAISQFISQFFHT